jgi:hypothetical protein
MMLVPIEHSNNHQRETTVVNKYFAIMVARWRRNGHYRDRLL